jgi:hypothetical protein
LDGTYLLLAGADVNLFDKNINATQKNTKVLLDTCKDVRLEANTDNAQ